MLSARDLCAQMDGLRPLHLEALDIALRLVSRTVTETEMPAVLAQIERVTTELTEHAQRAKATIERILTCKAQPSHQLPASF